MKKLAYISGALFSSLTILGHLFQIMHWELGPFTGGFFFVIGLLGLALIFIPTFASYHYKKNTY